MDEVWHWQRQEQAIQFDVNPADPFLRAGDWQIWHASVDGNGDSCPDDYSDLLANETYFIHMTGSSVVQLNLKGMPLLNAYVWPGNAYSLYGLPVPASTTRTFTDYFTFTTDIPTPYGAASHIYTVTAAGHEYVVYQPNLQSGNRPQRS